MNRLIFIIISLQSFFGFSQLNCSLVGQLNIPDIHGGQLNDIWGYVDETGVEYALVGSTEGTHIVSLADPASPIEVHFEPGDNSIWRDIKVFGDYAYITTEALSGLTIIDLSPLPGGSITNVYTYTGNGVVEFQSAHNLYMDENGIAYIFGANYGVGGAIMLDCATDPINPPVVGVFDTWYAHDGFARNDTLFMGHISDGFFSIVDVTDKANPLVVNTQETTRTFTHNVWPSDDGNTLYTTDELSGAFLESYDITDVNNIQFLDKTQSTPGSQVVPHNTHVLGDYLVTSFYSDGIVVHDATHPNNLIEVAYFDTFDGQTNGYDGCWGAYPFLPSGLMLASDRVTGLYVIDVDFQQGAYLEGNVTDLVNTPIADVRVTIQETFDEANTISNGDYANGTLNPGSYTIEYFKIGYYTEFRTVDLLQGQVTIQDVQMEEIPPYNFEVNVFEEGSNLPIENAQIKLTAPLLTHEGSTNALGNEVLTLYYQDIYNVTIGKWGYNQSCQSIEINNSTGSIDVYLSKGYYDDFTLDLGWQISGNADKGMWERAIPVETTIDAPQYDSQYDCMNYAFVTGNSPSLVYAFDNVTDGTTFFVSPSFDLTGYSNPYINYQTWFYNFFGDTEPNDILRVTINNGTSSALVEDISYQQGVTDDWQWKSHRVADIIQPTASMRLIVRTSDEAATWNVVEAGFDHFFVTNEETFAGIEENNQNDLISIYPNPSRNEVFFSNANGYELILSDLNGKELLKVNVENDNYNLDISFLDSGVYFARINNQLIRIIKE